MNKDWSTILTMAELDTIYQIVILIFKGLKFTKEDLIRFHIPTTERCFRLHPNAFCRVAIRLMKNDKIWERLPESFVVKSFRDDTAEGGENCLCITHPTREELRKQLRKILTR